MKFTEKKVDNTPLKLQDLTKKGTVFAIKDYEPSLFMVTSFDGRDYLAWASWYEGGTSEGETALQIKIEEIHSNRWFTERNTDIPDHYIVVLRLDDGTACLVHKDTQVVEMECELIYQEKR